MGVLVRLRFDGCAGIRPPIKPASVRFDGCAGKRPLGTRERTIAEDLAPRRHVTTARRCAEQARTRRFSGADRSPQAGTKIRMYRDDPRLGLTDPSGDRLPMA